MGKAFRVTSIVLIIALVLSGCGKKGSITQEQSIKEKNQPIVLKLATESAVGTPGEKSGAEFAKLVEEKTNGKVQIKYFPAGQLGTGDSLTELLHNGSVDLVWRVLDWYTKFEKGWNITLFGFLFKDDEHVKRFLESPMHESYKENLIKSAGIRLLSDNGIGAPRVLVSKKPVSKPDDLSKLKMRVPNIEMYLYTWERIGANVVQIPWGESYMALKQGMADALESPLGSIYGMKFHEAAKNITLTNHVYSIYVMAMNEKSFAQLPEDIKGALMEAAIEAGDLFQKYDRESVENTVKKLEDEGVHIVKDINIELFQSKLKPLAYELEKDGKWPEGLYEKVRKLK